MNELAVCDTQSVISKLFPGIALNREQREIIRREMNGEGCENVVDANMIGKPLSCAVIAMGDETPGE